jgi:hypothetical protein
VNLEDFDLEPVKYRDIEFDCPLGCGMKRIMGVEGMTDEEVIQGHYRAPIHHDHHMPYLGEPCFCGIDSMIWLEALPPDDSPAYSLLIQTIRDLDKEDEAE